MEFWGVEVKAGKALTVKPEDLKYLHLSQATLGELKKDKSNESVTIYLNIDGQRLVLGILSAEKFPQLSFDLVFEKEFELSHSAKTGSVYCMGYQASAEDHEHEEYSDSEFGSEDEDLAMQLAPNGKPSQKEEKSMVGKLKPEISKKADAKSLVPSKEDESDDDEDEDDDSDDESDEELGDDSDSDDGIESEEETPKKVQSNKKRPNESVSKTPLSKKGKFASAEKSDGKKGGHPATPHPAKKPGKTPVKGGETPKSGGNLSCKSCDKSFGTDGALKAHSKAKHGAK